MLLFLIALRFAQPACVDFTGHYVIAGEDGTVDVRITQTQCARVGISWESSMEPRTPLEHTLPLDGIARADTSWFGAGRIRSAGTLVRNNLAFQFTYVAEAGQPALRTSLTLEMLSNGDLCVTDQDTGRAQPPHIAKRAALRVTPFHATSPRSAASCA